MVGETCGGASAAGPRERGGVLGRAGAPETGAGAPACAAPLGDRGSSLFPPPDGSSRGRGPALGVSLPLLSVAHCQAAAAVGATPSGADARPLQFLDRAPAPEAQQSRRGAGGEGAREGVREEGRGGEGVGEGGASHEARGVGGEARVQETAGGKAGEGEEFGDGLTFVQHMVAGSIAGMTEHMAMFPVDTVKTRMQAMREGVPFAAGAQPQPPPPPLPHATPSFSANTHYYSSTATAGPLAPNPGASGGVGGGSLRMAAEGALRSELGTPSVYRALQQILQKEGPVGLYRGIGAMGLGAGPAHAVYFAVYELAKQELGGNEKGYHPVAHAASGALATVASDAVLTPMDVVKQRLQLRRSPYSGVVDCCKKVMEHEGIRAFYTSYRTTLVMNVPFTAVHFATYEAAKKALGQLGGGGEASEDHFATHLLAGGAAGALASAATNPLDVVKTRLQCQGVCGSRRFQSGSVLDAMRSLVKEEGPRVLWRGVTARVMFHTPAAAICWSTYEACKTFLKGRGDA